jgi:NAD(P)H-hydrate epimerase
MQAETPKEPIFYLTQAQGKQADDILMSDQIGYSLEMLMELAGQSITHAIYDIWKETIAVEPHRKIETLFLCGPGNNGGDGLVAARHLMQYKNFRVRVMIMKDYESGPNKRLLQILRNLDVPIWNYSEMTNKVISEEGLVHSDFLVDSLLGFSFKPPLRAPYDDLIGALKPFESKILSVDNPSGWDIEAGNNLDLFTPKYNIRYPQTHF